MPQALITLMCPSVFRSTNKPRRQSRWQGCVVVPHVHTPTMNFTPQAAAAWVAGHLPLVCSTTACAHVALPQTVRSMCCGEVPLNICAQVNTTLQPALSQLRDCHSHAQINTTVQPALSRFHNYDSPCIPLCKDMPLFMSLAWLFQDPELPHNSRVSSACTVGRLPAPQLSNHLHQMHHHPSHDTAMSSCAHWSCCSGNPVLRMDAKRCLNASQQVSKLTDVCMPVH
jgi:hypothetical protein